MGTLPNLASIVVEAGRRPLTNGVCPMSVAFGVMQRVTLARPRRLAISMVAV